MDKKERKSGGSYGALQTWKRNVGTPDLQKSSCQGVFAVQAAFTVQEPPNSNSNSQEIQKIANRITEKSLKFFLFAGSENLFKPAKGMKNQPVSC